MPVFADASRVTGPAALIVVATGVVGSAVPSFRYPTYAWMRLVMSVTAAASPTVTALLEVELPAVEPFSES